MNHTIKIDGGALKVRPYSAGAFVKLEFVDHFGASMVSTLLAPESAAAVLIALEQVLGVYDKPAPAPAPDGAYQPPVHLSNAAYVDKYNAKTTAPCLDKWAGSAEHFAKLAAVTRPAGGCNHDCNQGRNCTCGKFDKPQWMTTQLKVAVACAWGIVVIGSVAAVARLAGAL